MVVTVTVTKLLYRPLSLGLSVLGGLLAGAVFKRLWQLFRGEDDAPDATDKDRGWGEVLVAAALQGAVFGLVKASVDRAGAQAVRKTTGHWPDD